MAITRIRIVGTDFHRLIEAIDSNRLIIIDYDRFSSIVIDYHRFSSILVSNSWKRISSIPRLAPGTCCIYSVQVRSNMQFVIIFNVRVGRFWRGSTICDTQGTWCNLHFCNCAFSHAFSSWSKNIHRKMYWCSGGFVNAKYFSVLLLLRR